MITRITSNMQNILNISYSRESNCSSDDDTSNNDVIDFETGVTEVADVSTNPDETVVQPPDELVAKEVSAIVNYDKGKSKASTSTNSSASRVHIQETRNKRYTPAQQQRHDIYKSMVALFDAEKKKEEKEEDEIDMAFTACAVRMRIHLNKDQIEDVIQEVEGVVRRAINNVRKGMPPLRPSPTPFMQPGANVIQSPMSNIGQMQASIRPQQQQQQQQNIGPQVHTPTVPEGGDFFFDHMTNQEHTAIHRCRYA